MRRLSSGIYRFILVGCTLFALALMTGIQVASAATAINVVDSTGDVGRYTSVVLDASGNPVISYYDFTNAELKLAHCNDANCSGGDESLQTVDSTQYVVGDTSLVLDSSGNPVISYYDAGNHSLKLAHCNDANCSGGDESLQTVDSAGDVGNYASLALDSSGFPVISYYDAGNHSLKLAHCNDANCSGGNESIQTVDSAGFVGYYTSLALDSSGFPVISYLDYINGDLKLAHCNDANCSGGNESIQTVESAGFVGEYSSLALDSSGNPVISYRDGGNQALKLAHCNDANCSGGDESLQTVDNTGNVGEYSSLALDSGGNPVISYRDSSNHSLKLAHCNDANCSGGDESLQTIESAGLVGYYYISLALDSSGFPVISYDDLTNADLKLAHCETTTCTPKPPCLLVNCSFESPSGANLKPDGWKLSRLKLPGDGTDTTFFTDGAQSLRITNPKARAKKIYQDVPISGAAGDQIAFTFSWKSENVAGRAGLFRAMVCVYYTKGGAGKYYVNMPIGASNQDTYTIPITASKAYKKLRVEIDFGKAGTAWFDDLGLTVN